MHITKVSRPYRPVSADPFFAFSHSPFLRNIRGRAYTFGGHVGKITRVPDDPEDEQYLVTFNDGRTSYGFNQEHLLVEQDHNYEVWMWI